MGIMRSLTYAFVGWAASQDVFLSKSDLDLESSRRRRRAPVSKHDCVKQCLDGDEKHNFIKLRKFQVLSAGWIHLLREERLLVSMCQDLQKGSSRFSGRDLGLHTFVTVRSKNIEALC